MLLLGGCASPAVRVAELPALAGGGAPLELEETPFFPQEELQCGPAALATVLGAAGLPETPSMLVPEVYTPGLEGSLQTELLAAVRRRGLLPYEMPRDLNAVAVQLVSGRPVLILQNLGLERYPVWHYAVVVGLDLGSNRIILRSGRERRLTMSARKFLKAWDRAGRWGFVIIKPGEAPVGLEPSAYARAVAGLESIGRHQDAAKAWEAGLAVSPDEPVYLFGLGNARYALGERPAAREAWERYVQQRPHDAAGLNNLAVVLGDLGCQERGLSLAQQALSNLPEIDPARREIERTMEALRALPATGDVTDCRAPTVPGDNLESRP